MALPQQCDSGKASKSGRSVICFHKKSLVEIVRSDGRASWLPGWLVGHVVYYYMGLV